MNTRTALAGLLAASALVGCSADGRAADEGPQTVTVYAASSLKNVFEELAVGFEAAHPGVTVAFSFAGSSDLAAQIQEGAPADVFASADTRNMAKLDGVDPVDFATNVPEIVVPHGNPAQVDGLADLAAPGVQLVVCAPEVPCGAAAEKLEAEAGLDWEPVSEEQSVADVLGKVASGEADAGLVYVTDVLAAGDAVQGIAVDTDVVNTYPIASLERPGAEVELARDWIELVTGAEGQRALAAAGFGKA